MDTVKPTELIERTFQNRQGRTLIWATGTHDELIESGIAGEYMFRQLGDRPNKAHRTEYGDMYCLERRTGGRFHVFLELLPEPKNPHGMAHVDPYDTDISDILARIRAGGVS